MYARVAHFLGKRTSITADPEKLPEKMEQLEAITMDSTMAQAIVDATKSSMGYDISDIDILNIRQACSFDDCFTSGGIQSSKNALVGLGEIQLVIK